MAHELHRHAYPGIAASAIQMRQVVTLVDGGDRAVAPVTTSGQRPHGVALASALRAESVTVHDQGNVVKALAGASMGGGCPVSVGTNALNLIPALGASGVTRFAVGETTHATRDGEVFSLYVNPRQISNLI